MWQRHDDEGVEFVGAGAAVVLECVEEEARVGVDLETAEAYESDCRDEKVLVMVVLWGRDMVA